MQFWVKKVDENGLLMVPCFDKLAREIQLLMNEVCLLKNFITSNPYVSRVKLISITRRHELQRTQDLTGAVRCRLVVMHRAPLMNLNPSHLNVSAALPMKSKLTYRQRSQC